LRVRVSEQYLVLEFGLNLNQVCSGVGTAFPHLFFQHYTPAPYQILSLRNATNTGTAKLSTQAFATCKKIRRHKNFISSEN